MYINYEPHGLLEGFNLTIKQEKNYISGKLTCSYYQI